jgi:hypothetical protein
MQRQKSTGIVYYASIEEATLYSFRKVIETGDYNYLVYEGKANQEHEEILTEAWFNIYDEFSRVIGDSSFQLSFSEDKRIIQKEHKIALLSLVYDFLNRWPEPKLAEIIKNYGFRFDFSTEEKYKASLQRLYSEIEKMKLQLKKPQQEEQTKDNNLDLLITELEKFQGYGFDERAMTVKKFASIYKRFKDTIKIQKDGRR